jgi:hypothetical protein
MNDTFRTLYISMINTMCEIKYHSVLYSIPREKMYIVLFITKKNCCRNLVSKTRYFM